MFMYRPMDFIILKVNGTDVSTFPHEDAVRAFVTAQEPIVVELKRRISERSQEEILGPRLVSRGCQTELSGLTWLEGNFLDIDLEEVTLQKCKSDEKLGLTVCYSSGSEADTCTEVYIRDIEPQSLAGRDGRLRQGDQILQVNGKDVANKDETESLFSENSKAVTLLVSRCYNESEESEDILGTETIEEESDCYNSIVSGNIMDEDLNQHKTDVPLHEKVNIAPETSSTAIQNKFNLTNSLVRSKMDLINNEINQLQHRMQNIQLIKSDRKNHALLPPLTFIESDCEHIYETIPDSVDSEMEPIYSCPFEENTQILRSQSSHNGLRRMSDVTDVAIKSNRKSKTKLLNNSSNVENYENSSSAYNSGGSSNSNILTAELACSEDSLQRDQQRSTLVLCSSNEKQDSSKDCDMYKQESDFKECSFFTNELIDTTDIPHVISETMYTNVANLQQTMLLQQKLFRQALVQNSIESSCRKPTLSAPNLSQFQFISKAQKYLVQPENALVETRMEWKVKRRPDGTRYIARRPIKNKILKSRTLKILEERAGISTEDDTISELKVGRYWSKEERKKHLEKSKERKQRQEIVLASKNIQGTKEDITIHKAYEKINLLSSKKAANNLDNTVKWHKSKKLQKEDYEDIPTVQEMIIHGAKISNSNSKTVGLLSVTTV